MSTPSSKKKKISAAEIQNRRARYDYEVIDSIEAGLVLIGSEVKSIWLGNAHLGDTYCKILQDEAWLLNCDIEPYTHSSHYLPERKRSIKLLLHRKQIFQLHRKTQEKGLTLVPLKIYFKFGKAKLLIGLCKGKKEYDKRQKIAKEETRREKESVQRKKYSF